MELVSFVLGLAGEIVGTLVVDFVTGKSKRVIQDTVAKEVSVALAKHSPPNAISPEGMVQQVIEQIILLTSKPSSPVIFQDGEFRLREQLSHKPILGPKKKWEKKEIQARLWQLEQAIAERKQEISGVQPKPQAISKLPPLPSDLPKTVAIENESTLEEPKQDRSHWIQSLTNRIEERRKQELKYLDQVKDDDNAHS